MSGYKDGKSLKLVKCGCVVGTVYVDDVDGDAREFYVRDQRFVAAYAYFGGEKVLDVTFLPDHLIQQADDCYWPTPVPVLIKLQRHMMMLGWPMATYLGEAIRWGNVHTSEPRAIGARELPDGDLRFTTWGFSFDARLHLPAPADGIEEVTSVLQRFRAQLRPGEIPCLDEPRELMVIDSGVQASPRCREYPVLGSHPYWVRSMSEDPGKRYFEAMCRMAGLDPDSVEILVDHNGSIPPHPAPAFRQVVNGALVAVFTSHEFLSRILDR